MSNSIVETSEIVSQLYGEESNNIAKASSYNIGRTFVNANPSSSIKSEYTREDYNYYRQYEAVPKNTEELIQLSMKAYDKVGIVRNTVDLMSDFTCKGIKIIHENSQQEKFYNAWWEYINGDMVSEHFTNYLYRMANVVVNTTYGKVSATVERKWMSSSAEERGVVEVKMDKRRIPLKYTFLNPLTLEVLSPEIALFTGKTIYALRLSPTLKSAFAKLQGQYPGIAYDEVLSLVPKYILDAMKAGKSLLPVDNENMSVYFYRKDDWEVWAKPMISSILDDLIMLEKTKLADMSALDGAISNVRLWKLGSIESENMNNWIIPKPFLINKLRNILANNVGGGTIDLVWGPDIDFKESNTNVHNFLGIEKYEATLLQIYQGLGIPFSSGGAASGLTNNFIAMQTFVERLEYGRRILSDFWNKEIKKVQLAMGFSKPAQITFGQINLGDDSTYKQLLISLLDRDIISVDTALDSFGFSEIEKKRVQRDYKMRKSGRLAEKTGSFHSPNQEHELKKIILQRGGVAPSEVGLDLKERKEGEKSPNEQTEESQMKLAEINNQAKLLQQKNKPAGTNGRPKSAKDTAPRKQKRPPIQTKASGFTNMFIWGFDAQKKVSDIVTPILLKAAYNKPNVRSLSTEEFNELELFKFTIFSNLVPFETVTEDRVKELSSANLSPKEDVVAGTKILFSSFRGQNEREPTVEEMRQIQASGFALAYEPEPNTETEFDAVI